MWGGLRVEQEAKQKRAHHRVNVDRRVWEEITREAGGSFSGLVCSLLESYVKKTSTTASSVDERITVDITVDEALWKEASRLARLQGLSLSHVLRSLLREHLRKSGKKRSS